MFVILTQHLPEHGLQRGQVGTIVLPPAPDVFEVEISDDEGRTNKMLPLHRD